MQGPDALQSLQHLTCSHKLSATDAVDCFAVCHYHCDSISQGATILKHRIITNAGTGVVSVPFYEWNAIDASTPHARAKFLANKIKSVARFMQQAKRN